MSASSASYRSPSPVFLFLSKVSWIPFYLTASLLIGVSSVLPLSIIRFALGNYKGFWGWYPLGVGLLDLFYLGFMFAVSYFTFALCMTVFGPLLKRALDLPFGIREGHYSYYSTMAGYWSVVNGIILVNRIFWIEAARTTSLLVLFYRLMGMRIGKRPVLNSTYLYDPDLVEIGDNVTIGGDAVILAHSGERGVLHLRRTRLGNNVDIGQSSVIMQGVTIGDGAQVGALSLVTRGTVIGEGEVWGGVPARRLK